MSRSTVENVTSPETFTKSLSTINESDHSTPPPILVTANAEQNSCQQRASLIITEEDTDYSNTTTPGGQSSKFTEVTSTPVSGHRSKQPLPISPLHVSNSKTSIQDPESPFVRSHSNIPDSKNDIPDGATQDSGEKDPIMWIVTDSNM